jgi:HEAT repeats
MKRVSWFMGVCMCLLLSAAAVATTDKSDSGGLFIEVDGPFLTVKAKDIPHREILESIAERLGFELIINGSLQEQYSLDFEQRPWEEALKKALFPASWAFLYESAAGKPRLTKVFVLSPHWGQATNNLPAVPKRADTPSPPSTQPSEAQVPGAPEQEQKGLNASLTELLKDEDEFTRVAAINSIAAAGGERAVDALKQALQDQEAWVRLEAVEALAKIGGEQAMQGLQKALQDEHPYVQQAAQEGLAVRQRINQ